MIKAYELKTQKVFIKEYKQTERIVGDNVRNFYSVVVSTPMYIDTLEIDSVQEYEHLQKVFPIGSHLFVETVLAINNYKDKNDKWQNFITRKLIGWNLEDNR